MAAATQPPARLPAAAVIDIAANSQYLDGMSDQRIADRDFASAILHLANLLNRRLGPLLESSGITPQQWNVLLALARGDDPVTLAGLGRRLSVSKQNMTGMVGRLAQLNLVQREEDPLDLRSSRVRLARRGRNLVERLTPAYEAWLAQLAAGLTPVETRSLVSALTKLAAAMHDES
jgi:DNA-binding MarR family transcriptional regulator